MTQICGGNILFDFLDPILASRFFSIFHPLEIKLPAYDVVSHSRQIFYSTAPDHYNRVFLKIVPLSANVGVDFHSVPGDLMGEAVNLPIGIAPAAMSMNVVIHTGFGPVLRAARQLLSADGLLAIADRDYARLEVWDSPSAEALVSLIRSLVMRGDRDYHRAELAAETCGFRAVAGDCGRWQILEGARVLDAFSFVGCMNDSASAQRLKQALAHMAQDPDLPRAKLRVVDRWVVLKRESVRIEADRG